MDMNNATISGNVGRGAEVKTTPTGVTVTSWPMACSQGFGDKKRTVWVDCTWWGDRGAKAAQYITKGSKVIVSGSVEARGWTKKDGTAAVGLSLRVSEVAFTGGNPTGQSGQSSGAEHSTYVGYGADTGNDEDIPF